jgi:hypothetical protein
MYTNAQYADPNNSSIRCDSYGITFFVPCAPGNTDYARIMELVSAGELTIAAYVPPPTPPVTQITMRQCRLQLLDSGLLDDVDAAVSQADRAVQIEWEYATVVDRNSPLVTAIGTSLGLDEADIDQLFVEAAQR